MRLPKLDRANSIGTKIQFTMMRLFTRLEPVDIVKTLSYRPKFWGKHQNRLSQAVMRGPSEWKVWERELFAAFISRIHQCPF